MQLPPFDEHMGIEVIRRSDGETEIALQLEPHHLNRRGVAHGGVISYLLDAALGGAVVASIPKEWWCATTALNIQYLRGPRGGRLTARGRVARRGRRIAFAAGEVLDDQGRVLATATGNWHLWPYRPGTVHAADGGYAVMEDGTRLPVGKILAVGRNYAEHVKEMGAPVGRPPVFFLKPATAIVHDGATVILPAGVGSVHHEVELVVAIGKGGRSIPRETALEHVAGYGVGVDLTLRDLQKEAKQRGEPWSVAKGFDGSAPLSTFVPRDRVGDGAGLGIELSVNGEVRQRDSTASMTRGVGELIEAGSRWMSLERGDLLFTGTPAGVGPVVPGDRLEARIEKIGTLTVDFAGEPS